MSNSLFDKEEAYLSPFAVKYLAFLKGQGLEDKEFALELAIKLFGEEVIYELDE